MENENELDKFLSGLKEGEIKENTPDDNLFDFSEKKPVEQTEEPKAKEEDKEVPFHENPKVLRFIEKQVAKKLADRTPEPKVEAPSQTVDDEDPLTDVLTRVIGNDTAEKINAIKDFKKALESRDERVKQDALQEIQAREDQSRQAELAAENELATALEDIEDTFNVDITTKSDTAVRNRKAFLGFVEEIAPKDSAGNVVSYPDFRKAFEVFQRLNKPASNDRAKELASKSMNQTPSISEAKSVDSFEEMDKWLETLK